MPRRKRASSVQSLTGASLARSTEVASPGCCCCLASSATTGQAEQAKLTFLEQQLSSTVTGQAELFLLLLVQVSGWMSCLALQDLILSQGQVLKGHTCK